MSGAPGLRHGDPGGARGVSACGVTHPGAVMPNNQDSCYSDSRLGLAMAADGVGGHEGGAEASRAAVETISEHVRAAAALGLPDAADAGARLVVENHLRRAVAAAHERLRAANAGKTETRSHGGTTVAGIWAPFGVSAFVTVFHVGDSRVYRLRDGLLEQLTRDHSAYERWRANGRVGEPPAQKYILQALGVSQQVRPEIRSFRPQPGDRLLICTDGLTGDLQSEALAALLSAPGAASDICERLVQAALHLGARDNVTAVVCDL